MRGTARALLRLKLIEGDAITSSAIRLPPVSVQPKASKPERRVFNETARAALNASEEGGQDGSSAAFGSSGLPDNLRVEVADKKKTMFWKVGLVTRSEDEAR